MSNTTHGYGLDWFWSKYDPQVIAKTGTLPGQDAKFPGARAHLRLADLLAELYQESEAIAGKRELTADAKRQAQLDLTSRLNGELGGVQQLLNEGRLALARDDDRESKFWQRQAETTLQAVEREISAAEPRQWR